MAKFEIITGNGLYLIEGDEAGIEEGHLGIKGRGPTELVAIFAPGQWNNVKKLPSDPPKVPS